MNIFGAEFRIQMFEIPVVDRLSLASWNSQKGIILLEIRLDLNFKTRLPKKNYVCPENFLFWNPSNLVKNENQNQGASQTGYLLWYRHNKNLCLYSSLEKTFFNWPDAIEDANQILNTYSKGLPLFQSWKKNIQFFRTRDLWPFAGPFHCEGWLKAGPFSRLDHFQGWLCSLGCPRIGSRLFCLQPGIICISVGGHECTMA